MIEPSSADHSVATLKGNGVLRLELFATNATEKPWVRRARSIAKNAMTAQAATSQTYVRPAVSNRLRRRVNPTPSVTMPPNEATNPRMMPAEPRAAFIYGAFDEEKWSGFWSL